MKIFVTKFATFTEYVSGARVRDEAMEIRINFNFEIGRTISQKPFVRVDPI